eukprot:TRINITY_DN36973_c0_g1_i1.p1 TRINITY_DN36973_c0_g1~~TRINITY_DN36973_c0_g1_i1.p1  ORF type:complete len:892 (-),score=250.65 TRINITY_DN36973_c0_g1_i1:160-2835(-)
MAEVARRNLQEGMEKIATVPAGQAEKKIEYFNLFRRGVTQASSGREETPDALMEDLEPKAKVLQFLLELYEKKKPYRKQISATLSQLMEVGAWRGCLMSDPDMMQSVPEDVRAQIEDATSLPDDGFVKSRVKRIDELGTPAAKAAPEPPAESPAEAATAADGSLDDLAGPPGSRPAPPPPATAGGMAAPEPPPPPDQAADGGAFGRVPTATTMARVLDAAKARKPLHAHAPVAEPAAPSRPLPGAPGSLEVAGSVEVNLGLLQEGTSHMEKLGYSAANTDEARTAFETFQKAVRKVIGSEGKEDDEILEKLEPKGKILEFLVEFQERKRLYRSRVAATLTSLLTFDGWQAAALADATVVEACRDLAVDCGAEDPAAPPPLMTMSKLPAAGSGPSAINLRVAAKKAAEEGGIGALYVKVLAGYNLTPADGSTSTDPYVRLTCGSKMKRTETINGLNPKWDSDPFVFLVPDQHAEIVLEVLDSDFIKREPLGSLSLRAAGVPSDPGAPPMRKPLEGVKSGELEFEMHFAAAREEDMVPAARAARAGSGGFVVRPPEDPRVATPSDSPPPGGSGTARFRATAYHSSGRPVPAPAATGAAAASHAAGSSSIPTELHVARPVPWESLKVHEDVEYHSSSHHCWVGCRVTGVQPSGHVQVDVKPGYWMPPEEAAKLLRRREPAVSSVKTVVGGALPTIVAMYAVGDAVEYHSASAGRWIHAKVTHADPPSGAVQLDVKPGYWMPVEEQESKLRRQAPAPAAGSARPAGGGYAGRPTIVSENPGWVAWLSVDPRSSKLNFYPERVAEVLEAAWQNGENAVDLGESFFGASISLRPKLVQRTAKGSRDVRRLELQSPEEDVVVFVAKGAADYRCAETPFSPGAEERRINVPPGSAVARR